jgi:hypothetical protein
MPTASSHPGPATIGSSSGATAASPTKIGAVTKADCDTTLTDSACRRAASPARAR